MPPFNESILSLKDKAKVLRKGYSVTIINSISNNVLKVWKIISSNLYFLYFLIPLTYISLSSPIFLAMLFANKSSPILTTLLKIPAAVAKEKLPPPIPNCKTNTSIVSE